MASAWENFTIGGSLGFGSFNGNSAVGGNIGLGYSTGNGPAYGGWGGGYMGAPILPYGQAYQSMLGYGNLCTQLPNFGIGQYPSNFGRYPIQQPLLSQLYRPVQMPMPYPINGGIPGGCGMSPCGGGVYTGAIMNPCGMSLCGGGIYTGGAMSPCGMSPCGGGAINAGGIFNGGISAGGVYGSGNLIASLGMYLQGTSVMPIAAPRCQSCCTQIVQQQPVLYGSPRAPGLIPRATH
jgi:hypothetical protein